MFFWEYSGACVAVDIFFHLTAATLVDMAHRNWMDGIGMVFVLIPVCQPYITISESNLYLIPPPTLYRAVWNSCVCGPVENFQRNPMNKLNFHSHTPFFPFLGEKMREDSFFLLCCFSSASSTVLLHTYQLKLNRVGTWYIDS